MHAGGRKDGSEREGGGIERRNLISNDHKVTESLSLRSGVEGRSGEGRSWTTGRRKERKSGDRVSLTSILSPPRPCSCGQASDWLLVMDTTESSSFLLRMSVCSYVREREHKERERGTASYCLVTCTCVLESSERVCQQTLAVYNQYNHTKRQQQRQASPSSKEERRESSGKTRILLSGAAVAPLSHTHTPLFPSCSALGDLFPVRY